MEMDWTQALTIIFTVFGMLLLAFVIYLMSRINSNQKETNAKFEQILNRMDQKSDHIEQKIDSKFEAINTRFNAMENRLTAMEVEIKSTNQRLTDFQGQMNQRLSTIEGYLVPKKVFHFEEPHHKDDHNEPKEN